MICDACAWTFRLCLPSLLGEPPHVQFYKTAKKSLGNQARKAVYSAKKSILYLQFPPPVISLKLYDTLVKLVKFGASVMTKSYIELIELKYLKYILCLPLSTTNAAVRGELGQLSLHL